MKTNFSLPLKIMHINDLYFFLIRNRGKDCLFYAPTKLLVYFSYHIVFTKVIFEWNKVWTVIMSFLIKVVLNIFFDIASSVSKATKFILKKIYEKKKSALLFMIYSLTNLRKDNFSIAYLKANYSYSISWHRIAFLHGPRHGFEAWYTSL